MSEIQERKTTQKIVFKDSMGKPLANSKVEFSLSKHEFLFGCSGFLVADLVNQLGEENAEGNENVRQFLDVFNFATLPFLSYSGRRMHPNPKAEIFSPVFPKSL